MSHSDLDVPSIRQTLQLFLEDVTVGRMAATALPQDQQPRRVRVTRAAVLFPPLSPAFAGELAGVVAGAPCQMRPVRRAVVDAIRDHRAGRRAGEVVIVHADFLARGELALAIERPPLLFLVRVAAEDRLARIEELRRELRDVLKLGSAIRMRAPRQRLVSLPCLEAPLLEPHAQHAFSRRSPLLSAPASDFFPRQISPANLGSQRVSRRGLAQDRPPVLLELRRGLDQAFGSRPFFRTRSATGSTDESRSSRP